MSRFFTAVSADGTHVRAWTNDPAGPVRKAGVVDTRTPLVISNGLGASPLAWPAVTAANSGFRVVTWFHRGLSGSERPADPTAIRVADHAADLEAVMAAAEMDRAVVLAWSIGVSVAFQVALQSPERVAGLLGVGGVPGGSLSAMYGWLGLPTRMREPVGKVSAQMVRVTGPWLTAAMAAAGRPAGSRTGTQPAEDAVSARLVQTVLTEFARHDWDWYSRLVLAAGEQTPMDVSSVQCPVTLLAGRHDAVTSSEDMVAVARTIPGARSSVLPAATHLLPLQYPRVILEELRLLVARAAA